MGDRSPDKPPSLGPPGDRLDSWKEIAAYLNRDVTTVQRWEKREGMPVHRHQHDRMGSVYASRSELDAWTRSRGGNAELPNGAGGSSEAEARGAISSSPRFAISWRLVLAAAAGIGLLSLGVSLWLSRTDFFWRNPIANAQFQAVTDFGGVAEAAAISRDGQFVAFLSDRDGPMDVWVTQVGSGQFHNLTHGSVAELVNPSIRTLGFSPDGSLVTFWVRRRDGKGNPDISVWAVPTLGGEPRPYLEGVAEYDWSKDGSRLAYHTPGSGDPLYVSKGSREPDDRRIFAAPAGLHSHFPLWSPDGAYLYFVRGSLPDKLDIWRIPSGGGNPEQMTFHNTRVISPVFLGERTLLYLASDPDGSGPWLYSLDTKSRISHRLTFGLDRYTSLAAGAEGRRVVLTVENPETTLWRVQLANAAKKPAAMAPVRLMTGQGFSPRFGHGFLVYVAANGKGESLWKLANGTRTEVWNGGGARIIGSPAVSLDGSMVAFGVSRKEQKLLYVMQADGTGARVVSDSLNLQGSPAWLPDGQSITAAVLDQGVPHLYLIPTDGHAAVPLVQEYSLNPAWEPDGQFAVYSGPDVGTTFPLKAVTAKGAIHPLRALTLTRGARHVAFQAGGHAIVVLRGEIQHKNLWRIDLETGAEQQLTDLPAGFDVRDFDVTADGREAVLERVQQRSEVVLLELPKP